MIRVGRVKVLSLVLVSIVLLLPSLTFASGPRVFQILADKDNTFKIPGQKKAILTARANEVLLLRITARKGTESDKDGSVHSFTIKELKDQGWDLRLKEGVQEFTLAAPADPGEYQIECTVKCGDGHDDMKMKLIVTE